MVSSTAENLTELLHDWHRGNRDALDRLTPVIYDEIRRIAHRYMDRERDDHTLQTTALINEAYLRLLGQPQVEWNNRAHFFAVVAQVMRHVLIDHARSRLFQKRGGDAQRLSIDEATLMTSERASELIALDEALTSLASLDARKARVVELRYFGGFSLEETAVILDLSVMTVRRDWQAAKAWLYRQVTGE
jgi:RNA polymerase sigma factor (TIGR02999 family)